MFRTLFMRINYVFLTSYNLTTYCKFSLIAVIAVPYHYQRELSNLPIIRHLPAQSQHRSIRKRFEICSKLTIKTPEQHQSTSFGGLYCKLYTHFITCLVFVLLTSNIQFFVGSCLPFVKICERYLEKHPSKIVPKSSCSVD